VVNIATVVLHMLKTNVKLILCEDRIQTLVNNVMHTYIIITHTHTQVKIYLPNSLKRNKSVNILWNNVC